MQKLRPQIRLCAALAGLVAVLGSFTIYGENGVARLAELRACKRTLTDRAFQLLQENDDLRERIIQFHRDDRYLEGLARSHLGLVREREIVYRFAKPEASEAGLTGGAGGN